MRLMLGTKNEPSLLIDIQQEYSSTHFDFWVINGSWEGTFYNGYITIHHPHNPWSDLDKMEILCDNQDRLRGNYQDVFEHFHDVNYVAPKEKVIRTTWDDDDIPF